MTPKQRAAAVVKLLLKRMTKDLASGREVFPLPYISPNHQAFLEGAISMAIEQAVTAAKKPKARTK